jgi:biotin operon repressor
MERADRAARALNERQLFSLHGRVLLYIHRRPGETAEQIAQGLGLSRATVWPVIGHLRAQGMLDVERRDRRHHYSVNPDAMLRHRSLRHLRVEPLLGGLTLSSQR